jgi:hypothetical protein
MEARGYFGGGPAYGVLTLLAIGVLVGGYNAGEEALRFAPFPGITAADFYRHLVMNVMIISPSRWCTSCR